jgi:hypothetical protein
MVAMKMKGHILTTIVVISVLVICSSVSFYSSSYVNGGEASSESRVYESTSLSAKESFGWFDDIPDEGWELMKRRARTAVKYMNPSKPETGY